MYLISLQLAIRAWLLNDCVGGGSEQNASLLPVWVQVLRPLFFHNHLIPFRVTGELRAYPTMHFGRTKWPISESGSCEYGRIQMSSSGPLTTGNISDHIIYRTLCSWLGWSVTNRFCNVRCFPKPALKQVSAQEILFLFKGIVSRCLHPVTLFYELL